MVGLILNYCSDGLWSLIGWQGLDFCLKRNYFTHIIPYASHAPVHGTWELVIPYLCMRKKGNKKGREGGRKGRRKDEGKKENNDEREENKEMEGKER